MSKKAGTCPSFLQNKVAFATDEVRGVYGIMVNMGAHTNTKESAVADSFYIHILTLKLLPQRGHFTEFLPFFIGRRSAARQYLHLR